MIEEPNWFRHRRSPIPTNSASSSSRILPTKRSLAIPAATDSAQSRNPDGRPLSDTPPPRFGTLASIGAVRCGHQLTAYIGRERLALGWQLRQGFAFLGAHARVNGEFQKLVILEDRHDRVHTRARGIESLDGLWIFHLPNALWYPPYILYNLIHASLKQFPILLYYFWNVSFLLSRLPAHYLYYWNSLHIFFGNC